MKLKSEFFKLVKEGKKIVEGRLGNRGLNVGEILRFECDDDHVDVMIDDVIFYDTFEKMLDIHLIHTLPGYTLDEGLDVYKKIYGDKKDVVVAIRFHVIPQH